MMGVEEKKKKTKIRITKRDNYFVLSPCQYLIFFFIPNRNEQNVMWESFGMLILFNLYLNISFGNAKWHYIQLIQVHFLYAFII
jgi:hypothetical protein